MHPNVGILPVVRRALGAISRTRLSVSSLKPRDSLFQVVVDGMHVVSGLVVEEAMAGEQGAPTKSV
jgi:hypothetical protein